MDDDGKVVDLLRHKNQQLGSKLHEQGKAFALRRLDDDVDFGEMIGVCEDGILFLSEPEQMIGFFFTPAQARAFALELLGAATFYELDQNGMIKHPEDEPEDEGGTP